MDGTEEVENAPEDPGTEGHAAAFLPKPGDVIACDFRPEAPQTGGPGDIADATETHTEAAAAPTTLKIMSWNIHRGYNVKGIIKEIALADPDILFLQEVDMNCDRTEAQDIGGEIAKALGYNLVFACEFEEIYSPIRKPADQGGGVSGSCILSKYDFGIVRGIVHKVRPVEWEFPGPLPEEPRQGLHITPYVTVNTPLGVVGCYCVHLEEYCGLEARLEQFMEVIEDAGGQPRGMPLIIAGDFQTKAHGIARLSPWYCGDWMRLGSLGMSEDEVWEDLLWTDLELNPGFFDPFEDDIVTFSSHNGWLKAKTDHIRLRGLRFSEPVVGGRLADLNEANALSTHRWLSVVVAPDASSEAIAHKENPATVSLMQAEEAADAE